jgi:hypothetical protein
VRYRAALHPECSFSTLCSFPPMAELHPFMEYKVKK